MGLKSGENDEVVIQKLERMEERDREKKQSKRGLKGSKELR